MPISFSALGTPLLIIGLLCIFGALFLAFSSIGGTTAEQEGVNRSISVLEALTAAPEPMKKDLDAPFTDRVLTPLINRVQGITSRLTPDDNAERIRQKLDAAGNPIWFTVDRINGLKVIGFLSCLGLALVIALVVGFSLVLTLVFVVGLAFVGYMAPNLYLFQLAYDRKEKMQRALPDAIDLLTISVESGLGFDAACAQVARNTDGPLAEEFARLLQEMQIGRGRSESLRSLGERCQLPDLRSFVGAMVQADSFGIPVGQVLRVQSSEIRTKRRQWAEEKAQKVPVKILVPLIFCILPCLFIAVLGPAGISIMKSFSGTVA